MKNPWIWLTMAGLIGSGPAAELAYEPFDYPLSSPLTSQAGGGGWAGAWYQDGAPVVTGSTGLSYTDALGNVMTVAGRCADTSGSATTRNLRPVQAGSINNVWISFLWHLPASNSKFEGVSFYRGTQQVFTVSNPSTTTTSRLFLTSNLSGGSSVNSQRGDFGSTHFVALKLTKGGGTGGADRVEMFIDPRLTGVSGSPDAVIHGSNFDFDRLRIAGQDGATCLVDELRIGDAYADVAPHAPGEGGDSDGDGLTDAQEAVLGLNPQVDDSALIAAIRAHPGWFDLFSRAEILGMDQGGVVVSRSADTADTAAELILEVQQSESLISWQILDTFRQQITLPAGKNFLRLTLAAP